MSHDNLLLWLSARGEGSWSQFRGAVERIHVDQDENTSDLDTEDAPPKTTAIELPIYYKIRFALQRLAHIEFSQIGTDIRWRIVPPTIALLPGEPGHGIVCGARFPGLSKRLEQVGLGVSIREKPGMPQCIMLNGTPQTVASAAIRLGFFVQADAATAILSTAPSVFDRATWSRTSIPQTPGWTVHRFSPSRLRWAEATASQAEATQIGFFRFVLKHQRFYYLRWHGDSYHVPVETGKYIVMRERRGLLNYDRDAKILSIPAICRPPLLIERALVLCSGLLPELNSNTGRLEYTNIPPHVVRLAAQLLRQEA